MNDYRSAYGTPLDQSGPHPDPYHDRPMPWLRVIAALIVAAGLVAVALGVG